MKKRYQRLGVMGLAAVMACTGTVLPVLAGQASVAVDENMYVNKEEYYRTSNKKRYRYSDVI